MGWLREVRSSLENPATPLNFPAEWLLDIFNGGRTDSGIRVSELTALQVSTVYACVTLIAGTLASLPLNVYEQVEDDATRIAREQDAHWLLHDEPNAEMTSFTLRVALQCHALLWGNAFAEIERNSGGRPQAIWPLDPSMTRPRRALEKIAWLSSAGEIITVQPGELFFVTRGNLAVDPATGKVINERYIKAADTIHVPGLSLDGRLGKNTVELARQVIGLALATEKFGNKFFANGLRPTGVVELPQALSPAAVENFKRSLQEAYGGENMHRPMVLEEGMKWTQSTITPNEAQFNDTKRDVRTQICSIFHTPPHMIGDSDKSNRANTEQLAIEFVNYTMRPWIVPWEQELKRKLFPQRGRSANKYFPGFDLEDLLLPDAESRGKYFTMLKQWGVANSNDIRKKLRWNPIPGKAGNDYWMPVNMQDASAPMSAAAGGGATGSKPDDQEAQRYARAYRGLFNTACKSYATRQKQDLAAFSKVFAPVLSAISDGIHANSASILGVESDAVGAEVADFIADYVRAMHKRVGEGQIVASDELDRAVRALKIAVYRELATVLAKQEETPLLTEGSIR